MSPGPTVRKGQMIDEQWLPVVSKGGIFADRYEVSNLGRVRANPKIKCGGSKPFRILFQAADESGYLRVSLHYAPMKRMTVKVHRLVADSFLGARLQGHQVNHIDGDKTNNSVENLEFVSNKENAWHAARVIAGRSHVVVGGERMSVPEAVCRYAATGVDANAVRRRIRRYGWSIEQALSTPIQPTGRRPRSVVEAWEGQQAERAVI